MVGMKGLNKLQFTNTEPGTISRSFFFVRKLVVDVLLSFTDSDLQTLLTTHDNLLCNIE
jgi:hypothetical protein